MLETFSDFFVPLMRILDSLPNQTGQSGDVLLLFEQTYRDQIAPGQYTQNQSGNIRWMHNVRWSREKLKQLGFIDAPQHGIWRLTKKGHLWLVEYPDATHLSIDEPKSKPKKSTLPAVPIQNSTAIQSEPVIDVTAAFMKEFLLSSESGFLAALKETLLGSLKPIIGIVFYEFVQRSNYLQIRLAGFSGCHYQIILRRDKHEIALHFESSAKRSQARLRGFELHVDELNQMLKMPVLAGNLQSRGWTQVRIELQAEYLSKKLVRKYADLVLRFVAATFPILQKIYSDDKNIHRRSIDKGKLAVSTPLYKILDQEVETIRVYLQGNSSLQPSGEKLCDWVNFCYTFEMYAEGKDLFYLVSRSDINPWYYERTKKIAKACEQKVKLAETGRG